MKEFFVKEDTTILETLKVIDNNGKGIAIVVDDEGKLLGTITDGDIRRAILNALLLTEDARAVYNKNCKYLKNNYNVNEVEKLSKISKINCIPIVDDNMKVINVIDSEANSLGYEYDNPVLIMAGGLGTRLRPLTDDMPKPMLKVGDKPIIQTIIEQFRDNGFTNILLSVNYKSEVIEDYFKDGSNFGVNITYIHEEKRMGTAGAIKLAEKYIDKDFFVINGDILTNVNFERLLEYHFANGFTLTIGSRRFEMQVPYGVLNTSDVCVTSLEEKPVLNFFVSGGIYTLSKDVLKFIPQGEYFDITELINILIKNNYKIGSFPIHEYWMDIGQIQDYYKANEDIKKFF